MNPYYQNWTYGYTLAPSTDQSRGAYTTYGNNTEIKTEPADDKSWNTAAYSTPKSQAFVSSSNKTLSEEISVSKFIGPQVPGPVSPSTQSDPNKAMEKLHEIAVANRLIERYEKIQDHPEFKIKVFIGTETYEGTGGSMKAAKQNAALQALANTKYRSVKEQKLTMFNTAKRIGVTATSELHELAAKKGIPVEFKFLEPFNFEFKPSMRMWSKKEMLGNYRVQLNVCGYEFYGQAELPQQAKHNAATQALPIVRGLPVPSGKGQVITAPDSASKKESSAVSTTAEAADIANKNVNMALNEIAMINSCVPEWDLISETGPPHQKVFTWQLKIGEFTTLGTGPSKKIAKQGAAEQMMATLPEEWKQRNRKRHSGKRPGGKNFFQPPRKKAAGGGGQPDDGKIVIAASNPISCLHEYAKKLKIADPEFECVSETVLDTWQMNNIFYKKTEYTMKLTFDSKTYLATAFQKKAAKLACATEAWDQIRATIS